MLAAVLERVRLTRVSGSIAILTPASLFASMLVAFVTAGGCDLPLSPPGSGPGRGDSLFDTVIPPDDDGSSDADDALNVADLPDEYDLSISAAPIFCCDPFTIDFVAESVDHGWPTNSTFDWDFGDGASASGTTVRHKFVPPGVFLVTLTAIAPAGATITTELIVALGFREDGQSFVEIGSSADPGTIDDDVQPDDQTDSTEVLVADAGPDLRVRPGEWVSLVGRLDSPVEPPDTVYSWTQLSGPAVELTGAGEAYSAFTAPNVPEGWAILRFVVIVRAGDESVHDTVTVVVADREDSSPPESQDGIAAVVLADAGSDLVVEGDTLVTLDGSGSAGTGSDPLAFAWAQISGPPAGIANPTSAMTNVAVAGNTGDSYSLVFELTVSQGGATGADRIVVTVLPGDPDRPPASDAQVLEWLVELEPLPKVHYSWPPPKELLVARDPRLYEVIRIMHSIGLRGEWATREEVEAAVSMCHAIGAGVESPQPVIAINYSPWHRFWLEEYPPTLTGAAHDREIEAFRESLTNIRTWIDAANLALGSDVRVATLLFDSEVFVIRGDEEPDHEVWNDAIDQKYNAFYLIGKELFSGARIEWYARGTAWWRFTGRELADGYNTALYELPYGERTRAKYLGAYNRALDGGSDEVTPWVALGAGYDRVDTEEPWNFDWDYDLRISWQFGAEINDSYYGDRPDQYAPWHGARRVVFYPAPFQTPTPHWGEHFIAYVRGAHGIDELPQ